MALTLGQQKEAGHSPRLVGPFTGDMGPPKQGGTRYGSISSPPSPGPQQAPPGGTYLSEKIPIPDTESVRTLETSLARGAWAESRRVREPRRTTVSCGTQPLVLW